MIRPRRLTPRWLLILGALTVLSVAAWASAIAGAGSGTASITPTAPVAAGSIAKWSIQYTAEEAIKNGRVRVTVPNGWTAPQSSSSSSAGYVTVSTNEPTGSPVISASGQNIIVDVDTLTVGNTLTILYGDDSGSVNGRATAATVPNAYDFIVASDPAGTSVSPIANSPQLTVVAAAPDHIEIAPSDTTVVAGTFAPYRLIVRDQYGNRAPVASTRTLQLVLGSGQFFNPGNHSTPVSTINVASGTTSVRVDYKGTTTSPAGSPHSIDVFTTTGSPSIGGHDDVNVVPAALSTTQSTVDAISPVVADGATPSTATVTSKDQFGNPRSGDTVTISVNGSAQKTNPASPTDANGEATGIVTDTVAQGVIVSAQINGQAIIDTGAISFTAGAVSAATSTVDATTPVVADGLSMSTITVTARDANGNAVSGQSVTLAATPNNTGLTQPGGLTNASGVVTATLASANVGPRTVTATIGATPITDDATVTFIAGPVASFTWAVDGAATAGVLEDVTLTAKDAQGHTVTNFTGTVNLNTTSSGVGNLVVEWAKGTGLGTLNNGAGDAATYTFVAGDNGSVTLKISDTLAETITLSAVSGGANGTSTNLVVSSNVADVVQIIAGNNQTATVFTQVAIAPDVKVVDAYGNAVSGATVTFSVQSGGVGASRDAIQGGGLDGSRLTAADGTAACDVWILGQFVSGNPNTLRASIGSGTTPFVDFTATATAGAGQNLVITPTNQNVTVGSQTVLTATLTDQYGNPKSGDRIDIAITDPVADGTLASDPGSTTSAINSTARFGNSDATGKITVRYVAPAGSGLADVVGASTSTATATSRTYTSVASGATNYRITFVGGSSAVAGTIFHFQVEAVDGGGNRDTSNNSAFTLAPQGGSGLVFSPNSDLSGATNNLSLASGLKDVYGRGTTIGTWSIGASGSIGPDSKNVTITPAAVDHYDIAAISTPVTAGANFAVSVTARDQYNNLASNANNSITLSAIQSGNNNPASATLSVGAAVLSSGQVTVANEAYTFAEPMRVRVSDTNSKIGTSNIVTVSPAAANHITKISGDSGSIIAGQGAPLVVQVFDVYDNPVPNVTVNFAKLTGGGSIPASALTNASGNATQTLTTGNTVGTATVKATILDENPPALERVDFSVSTMAGAISNYLVTASKLNPVAHEDVTITVTGRDINNNPRTQDSSTDVTLSKGVSSAVLTAPTGVLANGVFTTTVHDDVAETFTVSAQTTGAPSQNGSSLPIVVSNEAAYQVFKVSGDGSGLTAGLTQPLTVVVRDQYNNTVANQVVTFAIASAPDGTASITDPTGDTTDGITITDGSGQATVTYQTALTSGANTINAQILDGNPLGRERVTFLVTTTAGGVVTYTVQMSATSTTAGVPKNVTVTGYDSNNNVVTSDNTTQVDLSGNPGVNLVFGATNPITLVNGAFTTSVLTNTVQTYQVKANTHNLPGVSGISQPVTVVPAAPAGAITASATQNPITANGTSTTTITSGVIKDQFGNQVAAGLNVNVSAGIGGVIVGGSPKQVDATGRISFDLRSSTTTGTSTVSMNSATGSASGSIPITFAPKPGLTANHVPSPAIVVPGQNAAFSVQADNSTATSVDLTTATTFTFSDGTHTYSANLAAPQTIPGNGNVTLVFSTVTIDPAFITAQYAPAVTLIGNDQYNSPVNVVANLPANSLLVTSIEITGIVPMSPTVSRGQNTTIAVTVKNNGAQSATINDVDVNFTPSDAFTVGNAPENGSVLGAGASKVFNVPVTVGVGVAVATYQVDAVASGTVGGQPVIDNSVAPHPFASLQVTTAASLAYEPGTLVPTTVSRGDAYSFQVTLRNNGGGLVSLDSTVTRLTFTDGTRTYSVAPSQPYAIPGGGSTQTMTFRSRYVPAAFTPGSYAVTVNAHGLENSVTFSQAVPLTGSNVLVQAPALVAAVNGTLSPVTVSKNTTATFSVQVQNTGGATVVLTPATTTIKFASNQYSAALNPSGPTTLPPGTTTLQFLGATVSNAIAMQSYNPTVQLTGTENGSAFSLPLTLTDAVNVQNPPAIAILSMTPSQAQFTTDQAAPITVHMTVKNSSAGAAATFSSASLRFINGGVDRTSQFVVSTPSTFTNGATLSPGETDDVVFNVSDNTGNSMTPGNMTIEGALVVTDVNTSQPINVNTDLGGKGNLQVMTPATITFDAVTLSQPKVTANMTRVWKVRALAHNTGGSDAVLTLTDVATHLNFAPSANWTAHVQPALGHGGATLSGGEADTLIFNVTATGSTPGPASIDVVTAGFESNSGRAVSGTASGQASVLVQTPGVIQVTSVVPSQPTITWDTSLPWTVAVTLTNTGQGDVNLALGAAVGFSIATAGGPLPAFTIPGTLAGGGVTLSGGETDQFVVSLTTTGHYTTPGAKNITVSVDGKEVNSNSDVNGTSSTASVTVQKLPDAGFLSLSPGTVSKLATVGFQVNVQNSVAPSGATITLDRAATRLHFGSGQFNVGLSAASPVDLVSGGGSVGLLFNSAVIPGGLPNGVQADAQLDLHWIQNGVAGSRLINLSTQITVQPASGLAIMSVRPSKATMTRQQSNAGTVTMVLRNPGGAPVALDLSPATTHLGFKVLSSGATVSNEYTITAPTQLESAGSTTLAGGATDSLVFNVAQAGVTTGSIIVNGYVGGTDQNSGQPVTDDTFDGGSASVVLQLPGVLSILGITPSQSTATVGQTTRTYPIKMAVKNTGGAAIDVSLSKANSFLLFSGTANSWGYSAATMANGVTLSGGETDTLSFLVTTTGAPAGVTTITGGVAGTETNTGLPVNDNTNSGGAGTITLQTPANLVVDSVHPSQPSITQSTPAPWNTTIHLHNAGQSTARLNLPAGFSISIQSSTGGNIPVSPVDLEEGGILLPGGASGTLVAHFTATGTFSSLGAKTLNVSIGATEVNSDRVFSVVNNAGTVTVQSAPNLAVTSVTPTPVTSGANVDFLVKVQNPAGAATVHFDRATTRARFASNAFSAVLDLASPDSIVGGTSVTLHFESKVIPTSIAPGPYDFNVDLNYTANGNVVSEPETVTSGVTVNTAPKLFIQSIATSQPTVTAGQSAPWTATMSVVNNGAADIILDLTQANTFVSFLKPNGQPDNTYTVGAGAMVAGDTRLVQNETGQIRFTVTQTGTTTGNIVISGKVQGTDQNDLTTVTDDTFDGGRGNVLVQTPAAVSIVAIHTTQPEVTVNQGSFGMRLVVQNTGGSDVDINLAGTNPSFTPQQGWTYDPTSTLLGAGGTVLAGGAVDSLLIPLHAGNTPGNTRLDAVMPWTQMNSQTAGSSNTTTSGFGHIKVESNPDLQVLATTSASPNPNAVNVNQVFNVQVTVKNLGGADAKNVVMNLLTDGGSTIQKPFPPVPVVAGFQSVSVLLPVTAASATNAAEKFTARITSATDENSGLSTLVNYTQAADSTATVAVQTPATADIMHVHPSQASVTRSQPTPWSVTVALHNAGQAGVNLTAPKASDLDFAIAGATKLDYIVQVPTKFASGATGWTLAGGATDSLTYTVSTTGADTGKVDIHLGVAGTDRNDPPHALSNSGATSVHVQDVAGLFIASTFPVGTFNHADATRDTVNTSFAYEIHVSVQNSGGEAVDSVGVKLVSSAAPNGATVVATSQKRQSIAANASREFAFRVTSRATPLTLETFTSSILPGVKSHNSQTTVTPQPPVDNLHQVVTQNRANLNLNLFVAAPPGSVNGTVGASQQFTLGALVTNPVGAANVTGPAQLALTAPGGFNVAPTSPLTQTFAVNDTIRWTVTAPSSPQAAANFSCSIGPVPNDVNTGTTAFVSKGTDTQSITVTTASALAGPDIAVTQPAGATDDILSVGQNFRVHVAVTVNHVKSLVSTLSVPGSFTVSGSPVHNFANAAGLRSVDYDLIAPALTSPTDNLFVTFTALDSLTNQPVPSAADTVRVTVVPRTSLSISAGVTYPPDAIDKTVTVGEPFRVTATVANAPNAADIAAAGSLTINLPAKYSLANGQAQVMPFTVGAAVSWNLIAAQQPSGPDQIAITISTAPADENSGQPALVTTGTANIAMLTQGSAVAVSDVSSSQNVGTPVAPGGSKNLGVMAFDIAYNVTDTSVPPAEVDTVAVTIIDKGGAALGPTVVAETLKRLEIDCGSQQFEVTNPATNPVLVSLKSGGKGFPVPPNGSVNAIVKLDLDASPRATELRVNVRGAGMVVTDPQSNQKLGVTNAQGQALDIKSGSLVILSSNFQEYAHNYPNPFSAGQAETKIAYFLDAPANVSIKIYAITGDLVHEEEIPSGDPRAQSGPRETTWDGRNDKGEVVRNGVYVCVLNAGGKSAKFRIAVAK